MNKICQNCKYHYIEEISFDYPQSCCNRTNPHYTTEAGLSCDKFECSEEYMKKQLEAYENMRKEAKKFIQENKNKTIATYGDDYDYEVCLFEKDIKELENILNKVGGSDETI